MNQHPDPNVWRIDALIRHDAPVLAARRAGDRLLTVVAGLPVNTTVEVRTVATGSGGIDLAVASPMDLGDELSWVFEDVARLVRAPRCPEGTEPQCVSELVPAAGVMAPDPFAFLEPENEPRRRTPWFWPVAVADDPLALLRAMRKESVEVRLHLAPCHDFELAQLPQQFTAGTQADDHTRVVAYLGTPVEARLLVGHGAILPPRVRAALLAQGLGVALAALPMPSRETARAWEGSADSLIGHAVPFGLARCLASIPATADATVCGLPTIQPGVGSVPLAEDLCRTGLRLGTASSSDGTRRDVRIGASDLLGHVQILGSTGSGKSSLLAALAHEAIAAGLGVSILDPHGTLVDRVLSEAPATSVERIHVVRSGDASAPVPINPLAGNNPELATDVIITVLRELFDPRQQGFMGPVWERGFASLMAAQRALLGRRANLALVPEFAGSQARLKAVADALEDSHPVVAMDLRNSFVNRRPEDFAEFTTWFVSKFQRMINSPELRGILGTGLDGVRVIDVIDARHSLLIDLASPTLGDTSAQLLGELWLTKHWAGLASRGDRTVPHLLIVDEAHLFASGLLPRLLQQARKFGLGVVLAHQNLEQLTRSLAEAVQSTCNNVAAFRTGIREARAAEERLGGWEGGSLTRLRRLQCAATLSSDGSLTDAFTLTVDHNDRASGDAVVAEKVEARSRRRFAVDLGQVPPLTFQDVERMMRVTQQGRDRQSVESRRLDEARRRRDLLEEVQRLAQSQSIGSDG